MVQHPVIAVYSMSSPCRSLPCTSSVRQEYPMWFGNTWQRRTARVTHAVPYPVAADTKELPVRSDLVSAAYSKSSSDLHVNHDPDITKMTLGDEFSEVVFCSKVRVELVDVLRPVTMITAVGVFNDRRYPDGVCT